MTTAPKISRRVRQAVERNELARQNNLADLHAAIGGTVAMLGSYSSGVRNRFTPGSAPMGGSANWHLDSQSRTRIVAECREARRKNSLARAMVARLADMVVGDGATVTSLSADPEWNAEMDRLWHAWADGIDSEMVGHPDHAGRVSYWGRCRLGVQNWCTDGDALWVLTTDGGIQAIEAERIVNPGGPSFGGNPTTGPRIIDGVELDATGRPVAYHVAEWDKCGAGTETKTRRIAADDCIFVVNPMNREEGMVRGEPALQSTLRRLEHIDRYLVNVGVAAEIATLFGLVIQSERPAELQYMMEEATPDQPSVGANEARESELSPGSMLHLKKGETATQIDPKFPTTNTKEYVLLQMAMVAADLGLPLVCTHFNSDGLSWSNIKSLMAIAFRGLANPQAEMARHTRRVRAWKARQWMASGELHSIDDYHKCDVIFPQAPVLDFVAEGRGLRELVDANIITHDTATQLIGSGPSAQVRATRQLERADELAKGIAPADMPGASRPGQSNTQTPPEEPEERRDNGEGDE